MSNFLKQDAREAVLGPESLAPSDTVSWGH